MSRKAERLLADVRHDGVVNRTRQLLGQALAAARDLRVVKLERDAVALLR